MLVDTILLAAEVAEEVEAGGGLFDFDATLPMMALQFVILILVLNAIFYKPLGRAIDEREDYVRNTEKEARDRLTRSEELAEKYERELGETRVKARDTIAKARAEATKIANQKVAEAQQEAVKERESAQAEIDRERQEALASLEGQVDDLSRQILEKLVGRELVS